MSAGLEPIAIVGIGCRLPGGVSGPREMWTLLRDGVDAVSVIPAERFDAEALHAEHVAPGRIATRWGGFVDAIDEIDCRFFEIAPRQAELLDPQQRMLLETTWGAMEDAGLTREALAGTSAGVYVGLWLNEYEARLFADHDQIDFHATIGTGRYAASGRLSYFLDVLGPSVTIDTACSSSLTAVHLACQGLRDGECDVAFAGGANAIVEPYITIAYSQSQMMTPDGRCKFGDAGGNGYVRSDGAVVLALKRVTDAVAGDDRMYAVIRGSAVTNDGRTSGLLSRPGQAGQEHLLRRAYAAAGVDPSSVQYIEAHGTGTVAGDPVELAAVGAVVGAGSGRVDECLVGSIKSNIGHTEGAAGAAGLAKIALAVHHGEIPRSLHFRTPNPAVAWDDIGVRVVTEHRAWPAADRRRAAVSAFGIAGTNAHVVVEQAPKPAAHEARGEAHGPYVLPVAATGREALGALVERYADLVEHADEDDVSDVCAAAATQRSHLVDRVAVVGADGPALACALRRAVADGPSSQVKAGDRIVFVFPGQGAQWSGMGRELLATEPVFAESMSACDAAIRSEAGWSPIEMITAGSEHPRADDIDVVQPLLFAVQVSLASLWRHWGIRPVAVVGHSMGEVAAAHVAGALGLDDAVAIICRRSALLRRISGKGAMAVVELTIEDAASAIGDRADRLSVAVSNSHRSTVIAGDPAALDELLAEIEADGAFCRRIKVDVASHSPQVDPLLDELRAALTQLAPVEPAIAFHSTVTTSTVGAADLTAAYWADNLRRPVRFGAVVSALADGAPTSFVEISPHPLLAAPIGDSLGAAPGIVVPSTLRDQGERASMLASLATLYGAGATVDWRAVTGSPRRHVDLPRYPWQRERHWIDSGAVPGRGADRAMSRPDVDGLVYVVGWRPAEERPEGAPASATIPIDQWLVVAGRAVDPAPVEQRLAADGRPVTVTTVRDALDDADEIFARLDAASTGVGVVVIAGGVVGGEAHDVDDCLDEVTAVAMLAAAADRGGRPSRQWVVTTGAHATGDGPDDDGRNWQAAPVWGVGRAVAEEMPGIWGGCVDVDPRWSTERAASELTAELRSWDGSESEVALRESGRRVPRLTVADLAPPVDWRVRTDAATLVTGGFGAVGRSLARWLAVEGARHLILAGRTELPPRSEWVGLDPDSPAGRRAAFVRELEVLGVAVHVVALDVADPGALDAFRHRWQSELRPPIRAVFHAAASFGGDLVADVTREAVGEQVMPKLVAAQAFDRWPDLDHLVLFSSFASVLPVAGQAAYAAGNAALDALAAHRVTRDERCVSISWGYWQGSDEVETGETGRRRTGEGRTLKSAADAMATEIGLGSFEAELGLEAMRRVMCAAIPHTMVARVDRAVLARARGNLHGGLASELAASAASAVSAGGAAPADRLRHDIITARDLLQLDVAAAGVRRVVGQVMRLPEHRIDQTTPFGALGLDSLMSIEVRNRLEVELATKLPATLVWNHPTVGELAAYVVELIRAAPVAARGTAVDAGVATGDPIGVDPAGQRPAPTGVSELVAEVAALTDADALDALLGDERA